MRLFHRHRHDHGGTTQQQLKQLDQQQQHDEERHPQPTTRKEDLREEEPTIGSELSLRDQFDIMIIRKPPKPKPSPSHISGWGRFFGAGPTMSASEHHDYHGRMANARLRGLKREEDGTVSSLSSCDQTSEYPASSETAQLTGATTARLSFAAPGDAGTRGVTDVNGSDTGAAGYCWCPSMTVVPNKASTSNNNSNVHATRAPTAAAVAPQHGWGGSCCFCDHYHDDGDRDESGLAIGDHNTSLDWKVDNIAEKLAAGPIRPRTPAEIDSWALFDDLSDADNYEGKPPSALQYDSSTRRDERVPVKSNKVDMMVQTIEPPPPGKKQRKWSPFRRRRNASPMEPR